MTGDAFEVTKPVAVIDRFEVLPGQQQGDPTF
jgi:hypothetical protein